MICFKFSSARFSGEQYERSVNYAITKISFIKALLVILDLVLMSSI